MPVYVALVNWTDQGAKNMKDTIKRADAFVDAARKINCKVREILYTMGRTMSSRLSRGPTTRRSAG